MSYLRFLSSASTRVRTGPTFSTAFFTCSGVAPVFLTTCFTSHGSFLFTFELSRPSFFFRLSPISVSVAWRRWSSKFGMWRSLLVTPHLRGVSQMSTIIMSACWTPSGQNGACALTRDMHWRTISDDTTRHRAGDATRATGGLFVQRELPRAIWCNECCPLARRHRGMHLGRSQLTSAADWPDARRVCRMDRAGRARSLLRQNTCRTPVSQLRSRWRHNGPRRMEGVQGDRSVLPHARQVAERACRALNAAGGGQ